MDNQTITAAAKGDTHSFKKIFETLVPKMRPVALRYVRTEFEADDILQEAFVKVFRSLAFFHFDGSFEGWVRKIVVNTALNHYKKNKTEYLFDTIESLQDEKTGIEEAHEIAEAQPEVLLTILQTLPDGYRMVINLYVLEDYSHKEIAEALGISESTSRTQFLKAKKMMLKLLARQRNEPKAHL